MHSNDKRQPIKPLKGINKTNKNTEPINPRGKTKMICSRCNKNVDPTIFYQWAICPICEKVLGSNSVVQVMTKYQQIK